MVSNLDQRSHTGSMELTMDGEIVNGRMKPFDRTDSIARGRFALAHDARWT
jgi:hypothetical protein